LISEVGLTASFEKVVYGFVDSLQILRNLLLERKKNKEKFSVATLAQTYLPEVNIELHNAIDDVKI